MVEIILALLVGLVVAVTTLLIYFMYTMVMTLTDVHKKTGMSKEFISDVWLDVWSTLSFKEALILVVNARALRSYIWDIFECVMEDEMRIKVFFEE